jgi:hypothetical protein
MFKFNSQIWQGISNVRPASFTCWNCGNKVSSEKAYQSYDTYNPTHVGSTIYICPHCKAPVVLDDEKKQIVLPLPGKEISKLPENILVVHSEIRKCMQSGCFNGAIMLMRKLIMHIAVEEGAEEGKSFVEYIDYLYNNGNIPKKSKNKSDSVRTLGNNTNHKIENRTQEEAQNCFELVELLLKVNYEFADEGDENGKKN